MKEIAWNSTNRRHVILSWIRNEIKVMLLSTWLECMHFSIGTLNFKVNSNFGAIWHAFFHSRRANFAKWEGWYQFAIRVGFPGIPVPESRESQWFFHSREWKPFPGNSRESLDYFFPLYWGNFPLKMKNWIVFY